MKKLITLTKVSAVCFFILLFSCLGSCTSKQSPEVDEDKKMSLQDRLDLAYQQEFQMTRDLTTNSVPKERLKIAEDYIKSQQQSLRTEALINWTERGPNNIAGRVRAILFDKADATGNTVFVGSVGGGLWKTTTFKTTPNWTLVSGLSSNFAVTCIAQDPTTPSILYVGTGEGFGNSDAISGGGLFKSVDGGVSWNVVAGTPTVNINSDYYNINDVKVDANGYVYIACKGYYCNYGGIFKSKNGGTAFTRILANTGASTCASFINAQGNDIQISNAGDVYVSTGLGNGSRVYVSKIASYTATTVGDLGNYTDITPTGTFTRAEIAVAPNTAGTIYGIFSNGNTVSSIQKSTDYGTTWVVKTNPNSTSNGSTQNFASSQAWYASTIAVDPLDANNITVAGLDACRSKDGGTTFEQISIWSGFSPPSPLTFANNFMHADHHIILYEPGSSANAIFGNDGGVFYSTNMSNAIGTPPTFTAKNINLNITQYYAADFMPTTGSSYILGGTQDNGTHKMTTAGVGAGTTVTGGDGGFCHIDQTDGAIQISSYVYNNYSISTNSGSSFPSFTQYGTANQGKFINPTDYDDANNILYTSTTSGRYGRLSNVGTSNTYTTITVTGMTGQISAVKVDPNTPTTVYVAANSGAVPEIYKVTNANGASPTFTAIPITGTGAPTAGAYLSSIDVEVGNSSHLLATCSNFGQVSVWESSNGGTSWTNVEGNLPDMPVRWCSFVPSNFNLGSRTEAISGVYLATEMGVWSTSALSGATTTWIQNGTNIGNVRTDMIKVRPVDGFVTIATHGRGLFSATLPTIAPVKVTSFTATKQQNNGVLNWQVTDLYGINKYEIQWSTNGLNFTTIGNDVIKNNQWNYQFIHQNISAQNYYRIKFINVDGSFEYSTIRYLNNNNIKNIDVFPNPFVDQITIRALQVGNQIKIYNAIGNIIYNKIATSSIENINLKNLPKGNYFVEIMDGTQKISTLKLIK